jgi:hypothetical protein
MRAVQRLCSEIRACKAASNARTATQQSSPPLLLPAPLLPLLLLLLLLLLVLLPLNGPAGCRVAPGPMPSAAPA